AVRDFFTRYQDRLLFGTDIRFARGGYKVKPKSVNISLYPNENPNVLDLDLQDVDAVRQWQNSTATDYSNFLQYFETQRVDLPEPTHSGGPWLRIFGVGLPAEVLEKFYHGNAERLIFDLRSRQ